MRKITEAELREILELHEKWLNNEPGGKIANLSNTDLSHAYLRGADLRYADLSNIRKNKNCYQVAGVGRASRLVSYFVKEDIIVCGCWKCEESNTLENFKKRVESVYGEDGEEPNELFYGEYQDVIKFFESRRKYGL